MGDKVLGFSRSMQERQGQDCLYYRWLHGQERRGVVQMWQREDPGGTHRWQEQGAVLPVLQRDIACTVPVPRGEGWREARWQAWLGAVCMVRGGKDGEGGGGMACTVRPMVCALCDPWAAGLS